MYGSINIKRIEWIEIFKIIKIPVVIAQRDVFWRNKFGWGLGEFALQDFKGRHIPQNVL